MLSVPFFKQTTQLNCGPTAIRMALAYFGSELPVERIEELVGIKNGRGVSSIKLAIAAAKAGQAVSFFSRHLTFNQGNQEHSFYQSYGDVSVEEFERLLDEAKRNKVQLVERTMPLCELIDLTQRGVPIVLVDWNIIKLKEGYQGHFIVFLGADETHVVVNNPGADDGASTRIERDLFDRARVAKGTDEDIILIKKVS